jgi:uncharacterized protein
MEPQKASVFAPEFITDLKKIENLSQKNSTKNFEFSQWLKTQDGNQMDEIVKKISLDVAAGIDCTQCANCCKALVVAPDYRDISELANHVQISTLDFKKKYLKKDTDGDLVFKQKPCPFLKNNKCSVYSSRPQLCRNYPYLDKGNFLATLNRVLANLFVCPIAFNTFELLKLKFT